MRGIGKFDPSVAAGGLALVMHCGQLREAVGPCAYLLDRRTKKTIRSGERSTLREKLQ